MDVSQITSFFTDIISKISMRSVIYAIITFLVCFGLKKGISALVNKGMSKAGADKNVTSLVQNILNVLFVIVTVFAICAAFGINLSSVLAIMSVLSLGIALALQDVLTNIAAGVIIRMQRPFAIGDYVDIAGAEGTVTNIYLTTTRLVSLQGVYITVNNKEAAGTKMMNYTKYGRRRLDLEICASYDCATADVREALLAALTHSEDILDYPAPKVTLHDYRDSDICYLLTCWVLPTNYYVQRALINESIREEFDKKGLIMTYAHLNVHIVDK